MNLFKKHKPDDLLADLPRGQEGRAEVVNFLPQGVFENPSVINAMTFQSNSADTLLGQIGEESKQVKRTDGRIKTHTAGGKLLGSKDDLHLITVAGSRFGEGPAMIIPNLLHYGASMAVFDPKGENANVTALHRRDKLDQTVYALDPFQITDTETQGLHKPTFQWASRSFSMSGSGSMPPRFDPAISTITPMIIIQPIIGPQPLFSFSHTSICPFFCLFTEIGWRSDFCAALYLRVEGLAHDGGAQAFALMFWKAEVGETFWDS